MFFSADEAWTKDAWQEALRRDHEENLLRPVRGRTGTFFLLENSKQMLIRHDYCYKCWSGLIIVTIAGHCWHHADNRADAQLWCEEHLGLQRGGRHQPGGGWAEGDGVRCLLFNLQVLIFLFSYFQHSFQLLCLPSWLPASVVPNSRSGWGQKVFRFILFQRFLLIISYCILKSRVFSKTRWSGTKLTKSSETEESGFTGPGPSSIRQTFLMLQAYDNLWANSKCVFFS